MHGRGRLGVNPVCMLCFGGTWPVGTRCAVFGRTPDEIPLVVRSSTTQNLAMVFFLGAPEVRAPVAGMVFGFNLGLHLKLPKAGVFLYAVDTRTTPTGDELCLFLLPLATRLAGRQVGAAVDIAETKLADCRQMFFGAVPFVPVKTVLGIFFRNFFHKPVALNFCRD